MGAESRLGDHPPRPSGPGGQLHRVRAGGEPASSPGTGPCAPRGAFGHGEGGARPGRGAGLRRGPRGGAQPLATTRAELGSLDRVRLVVKVLGMVHWPRIGQQPQVINGFSDLMIDVFGEAIGKHACSAVGMAELPMGIPVEIEMILEVE